MILIPELRTVALFAPRTGSGSLSRAILERYPDSFMLYRHMEADGIPLGYDQWRKVGIVRDPLCRMASLYNFCHTYNHPNPRVPGYIEWIRASVEGKTFAEWLLHGTALFTQPLAFDGSGRYCVRFSQRHAMAEQRKSQWFYYRPDLGTELYPFHDLTRVAKDVFDVTLPHKNRTDSTPPQSPSPEVEDHIQRWHGWDRQFTLLASLRAPTQH